MQSRTKPNPRALRPAPVRTVALDVYERARDAWFKEGTLVAVKRATGLDESQVARLVDSGIPEQGIPSLRSLTRLEVEKRTKAVVKRVSAAAESEGREQAEVLAKALEDRTSAQKAARADQAKVLGDVQEARREEVQLVRLNRRSAMVLANTNADLLRVGIALAHSLVEDLPALVKKDPGERMRLLRTIASVVHRGAQAAQLAVQMEHLLMGEPTAIIGHTGVGPSVADMTADDAEKWFKAAERAFLRRRARATVIESTAQETGREGTDEDVDELTEDL
jgi:hypothetical protein